MKSFVFALAALPLILAAAEPVLSAESSAPKVLLSHGSDVVLALDQDGTIETSAFEELAIGQSRQILDKNGNIVTVTRSTDALTIDADGKTTRIQTPAPGDTQSRIEILRTGEGHQARRIVMLQGEEMDIDGDVIALGDLLDSMDTDIEKALADARIALKLVDRTELADALDQAGAQIDAIDIQTIIADAKARGGNVMMIRSANKATDTTD